MSAYIKMFKGMVLLAVLSSLISCGGAEERKQKYLDKGISYFKENNLEKAKIEFKNVLQIDPKFAPAYFYMGQLEEVNKEFGRAIGNYQKAVELDKDYIDPKLKLAKIYVIIGTNEYIEKSNGFLKDVFLTQPENIEAKLIQASIEYKTGDKNKAIQQMQSIVKVAPSNVDAITLLSVIYAAKGDELKAIDVLKKGVESVQNSVVIRYSLAGLLSKNGQLDEAQKQLEKIVALDPDTYRYRTTLSSFYSSRDKNDMAEQVLRDAINHDPDDVKRYLVLIQFIASNKSVNEAEAALLGMISEKQDLYDLRFALSEFYIKVGLSDKAKDVLNTVIDEKSLDPEGVKARIALASIFNDENNSHEALKLLEVVLNEFPNNSDALLLSSKLALSNGDSLTAINGLRTVLKGHPKNTEAAFLLANAHMLNNESALAEDVLKNSLSSSPVDYNAHLNYAKYLASVKRAEDAMDIVDKALLSFKDNYELLDFKLTLAAVSKDDQQISSVLNAMQNVAPDRGEVYVKKGQYYLSKKDYSNALAEFENALTKMTDKYTPLNLIVKTYFVQNQVDKAVTRLNQFLEINKNSPIANELLGNIYAAQKNIEKSINYHNLAIQHSKDWPVPYLSVAAIYVSSNNTAKAIDVYNEAIKNLSNPSNVILQLAALYEKEKNYTAAMNEYEKLLTLNPANKLAANNLAALLLDVKNDTDSINRATELTRGFDKLPQLALKDTLGWVYVKSGDFAKAVTLLTEVVEAAPNAAVFKYHLGVALNHAGKPTEAKQYLTEAVNSEQEFMGKSEAANLLKTL